MPDSRLKKHLDDLYKQYNTTSFIENDPIRFVHRYSGSTNNQEVVGFIVSTLAFGQRRIMIPFMDKVLSHLSSDPYDAIITWKIKDIESLKLLVYRFIKGIDIVVLLYRMRGVLKTYGSIESLFKEGYEKTNSLQFAMSKFVEIFNSVKLPDDLSQQSESRGRNLSFLLPSPNRKSACKRFHLFLRWMVRKDSVDVGLWKSIPEADLMIPLDTHVAKISKELKLTKRSNLDWKMAEEITNNLKALDPTDPAKYDFALFGYGLNRK